MASCQISCFVLYFAIVFFFIIIRPPFQIRREGRPAAVLFIY